MTLTQLGWTHVADQLATDDLIRLLNTRMTRVDRALDTISKAFLPVINVYQYAQDGTAL